ncbi:unnamed protein product, partial [Timema podura]|nr:unnamed protein product [Timema podura]
ISVIQFVFRSCHLYSFIFQFIYLAFFRTTSYFGIPDAPSHTNLVQMILTLKLVGLAFEVHDTAAAAARKVDGGSDMESTSKDEAISINPGFLDIFHYSFAYIGVLTASGSVSACDIIGNCDASNAKKISLLYSTMAPFLAN